MLAKEMKQFIIKHQVFIFCTLNIILTILIVIIYSLDEVPQQWAPAILAILIVYMLKGKANLKELLYKMAFRKTYLKWYVSAFMIPLIICAASYTTLSMVSYHRFVLPTLCHSLETYLIYLFFIVFGSVGEEIGWRGYMLPLLLRKYSYLISSIIIGLFWGIWHLQFQAGCLVFIIYLMLTIEMSITMSWFCKKTNGNIVSAIIMHSSFNLCALLLFENVIINISQYPEMIRLLYVSFICLFFPLCIYIILEMKKNAVNK